MRVEMHEGQAVTNTVFARTGTYGKGLAKDLGYGCKALEAGMIAASKDNYVDHQIKVLVVELDVAVKRVKHLHKIRYKVGAKQRKQNNVELDVLVKEVNDILTKIHLITGKTAQELGIIG